MLYKTIILNLLEENPPLYEELCQSRKLLSTLNRMSEELREDHLAVKHQLRQAWPTMGETQIAAAALEIALKDLSSALLPDSEPSSDEEAARTEI